MLILESRYNPLFVILSITVAIFASYVALDLANSVHRSKGRMRAIWLSCGALAMGFGIWSMHFVGMLAFTLPGVPMGYDVPLVLLSIAIAVFASALALHIVSQATVSRTALLTGGIAMAAAIAGMHYTGMYAMRMPAKIVWNLFWVTLSILIALFASFTALLIALRLRTAPHLSYQRLAAIVMGLAIVGMHYSGMWAATFVYVEAAKDQNGNLLATSELGVAVVGATALILGVAWTGSVLERAFSIRTKKVEETSRLYREAENAVTQLEQERKLRERFVSALAHDLRTPLAAARISTQLSIRYSAQPDESTRFSGRVLDNLRRMDQMIQDMLDAHRINAGKPLPIHRELCSLRSVLESSYEDLATVHGERFVLDVDESISGMWDAAYLRRAIENLCANAVKYGSKDAVKISAKALASGGVLISVLNQGPPIPSEGRETLFDLFRRGSEDQIHNKRGWGLGLTIVKGVAEAHGGMVEVKSDPENGTIFSIRIPTT